MKNPVNEKLMQGIQRMVKPKPGKRRMEFIEDYYHRISTQDYGDDKAAYFFHAAMAHLKLAESRQDGEILIGVNNLELPGTGIRTLISIVTDDRPFLIASLTITLNHLDHRIERTLHPLFQVQRNSKGVMTSVQRYRSGEFSRRRSDQTVLESFIQFEVDPIEESAHGSSS